MVSAISSQTVDMGERDGSQLGDTPAPVWLFLRDLLDKSVECLPRVFIAAFYLHAWFDLRLQHFQVTLWLRCGFDFHQC